MGDLYSIYTSEQIKRNIDIDKLDSEMCVHLTQDLHFYIDNLHKFHIKKISQRQYNRIFSGYCDINQMWDNVRSAIGKIQMECPEKLSLVPKEYLQNGVYFDHPSTWIR